MPKVSVIVPIFGVEQFIERCARSLFEQSLDDMEFIFVNDATKDNSMMVLERVINDYPKRQGQIRILTHKQNKGLSHARETGVKEATGEYIAHCDSDDWVDHDMYKKLYQKAKETGSDFVKCAHYVSDGINKKVVKVNAYDNENKESIIARLISCQGWNSVWDTLVNRRIFENNNILFTDDTMLEDFFISTQILTYSNKIVFVQDSLYYYFQNPNSICNVPSKESIINRSKQSERSIKWMLDFIHYHYQNIYNKEEVVLKYIPRKHLIPIMYDYSNYKLWNKLFPGNSFSLLKSKYISNILKTQYLLVETRLYPLYFYIFKKF